MLFVAVVTFEKTGHCVFNVFGLLSTKPFPLKTIPEYKLDKTSRSKNFVRPSD